MNSNISLLTIFLSALIGGTVTAALYPISKYFIIRWMITRKLKIELRLPDESPINPHISHPLRIINRSHSTVKVTTCFIFIEYLPEDMIPPDQEPNIMAYRSNNSYQWTALSWARVIDDKIRAIADLNIGEEADLNVFRFHRRGDARPILQIASEQGFYKPGSGRVGRMLLFADKDYLFKIKVTGDNIFPVTKSFRFNHKGGYIQEF